MITLEPLGCFGIEQDDRIVATTTLLTYGKDLAWVGMVLTHGDYQRRGYARQLVTAALEQAGARGIRSVKLDATDQGRALYASLDFKEEQPIARWRRSPAPLSPVSANAGKIPFELDRRATGADRSAFLTALGSAMVADNAFLQHRPGARANHLGPCIAACFERCFSAHSGRHRDEGGCAMALGYSPGARKRSGAGSRIRLHSGAKSYADVSWRKCSRR